MDDIINAIWELRTVFTFLIGVAGGLVIASLLTVARQNTEDDGPPTITIPPVPYDEPMGDMVDVRRVMKRWEAE